METYVLVIISLAAMTIGGQSARMTDVIVNNNDNDVTSIAETELKNNYDLRHTGSKQEYKKIERVVHDTPESRLVLDDIDYNIDSKASITQNHDIKQTYITGNAIKSQHQHGSSTDNTHHTIKQHVNRLHKQTDRSNLMIHDHTIHHVSKADGKHSAHAQSAELSANGAVTLTDTHREGNYRKEKERKVNLFRLHYIPKDAIGTKLFTAFRTVNQGEEKFQTNERMRQSSLKITPEGKTSQYYKVEEKSESNRDPESNLEVRERIG